MCLPQHLHTGRDMTDDTEGAGPDLLIYTFANTLSRRRHGFGMQEAGPFQYVVQPSGRMRVPVRVYADGNLAAKMSSDRTLRQAANVATLPGIVGHVVVLPDGHEGYGFPVGGVAATDEKDGVISPGGVGYDINCGVRLVSTRLRARDITSKLPDIATEMFRSIPSGVGSKGAVRLSPAQLDEVLVRGAEWAVGEGYGLSGDAEACEEGGRMAGADPGKVSERARKRGAPQLGSLGSGNHFLEIQRVDSVHDKEAARAMGLEEGQVTVLIHCGSRGFGHQVCSDYLRVAEQAMEKYGIELPDRELACVPNGSEEGASYRAAMAAALNFAWANRQMITHWTRKALARVTGEPEDSMKLVYDVSHNIAKSEEHVVDGEARRVVVHRKGATRAFPAGRTELPSRYVGSGQPVFIPGSMGTASWVLLGKPGSMELSFGSTAHGAGRTMSRSRAKREYTEEQVRTSLGKKGIQIRALTRDGVVEETPQAYKDVDAVATVSDELGIATKVARLVPLGVIKG